MSADSPYREPIGPLMTLQEVADFLKLHKITIYQIMKRGTESGQFRVGRYGDFYRVTSSDFRKEINLKQIQKALFLVWI
jgi:hypothetical protein